jgi:hypothetical protein
MIDELNQIGNINSINDFLEFKFSVKTIVILVFLASCAFLIFTVVLFGGVNNTVEYLSTIIETTKTSINKNKNISNLKFKQNKSSNKESEHKENEDEDD